jgi:hypothetical protein
LLRVPTTTGTTPSIPPSVVQPSAVMCRWLLIVAYSFFVSTTFMSTVASSLMRSRATRGSFVPKSVIGPAGSGSGASGWGSGANSLFMDSSSCCE